MILEVKDGFSKFVGVFFDCCLFCQVHCMRLGGILLAFDESRLNQHFSFFTNALITRSSITGCMELLRLFELNRVTKVAGKSRKNIVIIYLIGINNLLVHFKGFQQFQ